MKRILIVGVSGSGKTYTALKLSKLLNITPYNLDDYYWEANWQPVDKQEYIDIITELSGREYWIISGNFSSFNQPIWQRCDSIIWLDYNIFRCLTQSFIRSIKRIIYKLPCCNNNYETFGQLFFSKNSIILWVLKSYNKRRSFYNEIFKNSNNQKILLKFLNPKMTNSWLSKIDYD